MVDETGMRVSFIIGSVTQLTLLNSSMLPRFPLLCRKEGTKNNYCPTLRFQDSCGIPSSSSPFARCSPRTVYPRRKDGRRAKNIVVRERNVQMIRWIIESSLRLRFLILVLAIVLAVYGFTELRKMPVDVYPEFRLLKLNR
jgi:hypothetical protein